MTTAESQPRKCNRRIRSQIGNRRIAIAESRPQTPDRKIAMAESQPQNRKRRIAIARTPQATQLGCP
eukprot:7221341-Alexandrium_andersonii.AAC.1